VGKPVEYFRREPWVNPNLVIVGGISRGGILSMAYARQHPKKVAHQGTLLVQGKSTYAFTLEAKRSKALI
jgi:hypothetical protein